jgi:hypothetical protein
LPSTLAFVHHRYHETHTHTRASSENSYWKTKSFYSIAVTYPINTGKEYMFLYACLDSLADARIHNIMRTSVFIRRTCTCIQLSPKSLQYVLIPLQNTASAPRALPPPVPAA